MWHSGPPLCSGSAKPKAAGGMAKRSAAMSSQNMPALVCGELGHATTNPRTKCDAALKLIPQPLIGDFVVEHDLAALYAGPELFR